jgi:hypothetical protein
MAIVGVLTNALVLVNGVDLSDHCETVTVSDERSQVPITAMGATANAYTKGLGDASITLSFYQDMAAGKVHATLQPLINSTTPVAVEVRPLNAGRSATNPAFVLASALMFNYTPVDGGATDSKPSQTEPEFSNASSSGGMSYLTA